MSADFQTIGKDVAVCSPIIINKSALLHIAIFLKVPIAFGLCFPLRLFLNEGKWEWCSLSSAKQYWRTGLAITMHSKPAQKQLQHTWLYNLKLWKKKKKFFLRFSLVREYSVWQHLKLSSAFYHEMRMNIFFPFLLLTVSRIVCVCVFLLQELVTATNICKIK